MEMGGFFSDLKIVNFFIGVTDQAWFDSFSSLPAIDEVNFWQPSGKTLSDNSPHEVRNGVLLRRDLRNICVQKIFRFLTIFTTNEKWS